MSSSFGAMLLTVALTANAAGPEKPQLPSDIVAGALAKAQCTVPASKAAVVGTERLSHHLALVGFTCWRGAYNAGSILFAAPVGRPQHARLLMVESWRDAHIEPG